jgi:hypothetical protein
LTPAGNVTRAVSVAKLTAALTPSSRFSLRSILAAQDAQVIPPIASSATVMSAQPFRLSS